MKSPRARGWIWPALAALVAGGLLWLWRVSRDAADEPAPPAAGERVAAAPAIQAPAPLALTPEVAAAPQPSGPALAALPPLEGVRHSADPCTAVAEPRIPEGFEVQTVGEITVAWAAIDPARRGPLDRPFSPAVLGHVVAALLDEAAALTGTPRRARLAVVVYAGRDEMLADSRAPRWAGGLYDGGALRLPAQPREDLGVALTTLRHEVMHAQLHAGAGCMPVWLDEGLATYFGGRAPMREWASMLRRPEPFDLAVLEARGIDEASPERARRIYAQSLAMIAFLIESGGEGGIGGAIRALREAQAISPREALAVWQRLKPGTGSHAVLEALAKKLFRVPLGGDLDRTLAGPICCAGLYDVHELTCRGGAAPPGERQWIDRSTQPWTVCRTDWTDALP